MLVGNLVDLELMERGDLPLIKEWINDVDFVGAFEPFEQESLGNLEKQFDELKEGQWYLVKKKDASPIGYVAHFKAHGSTTIGYMLLPEERGKGIGSEAVQMIVDYLYLHKDIVRIQAETHPENIASQRVLEKAGFQKEGIRRMAFFSRGVHRDTALWSIIRNDWDGPRVLPRGHEGN
jgi:RimJ/RimL family protein N-acetyltransferase